MKTTISSYWMLLASAALFFSCEKQDVRLHTVIHEDGTCEREVIYNKVMTQEERDSRWSKDRTSAPLAPVPECVNMEGFMGSHTDIGDNDTVTTTLEYREFKDVKEKVEQYLRMCHKLRALQHLMYNKKRRYYTLLIWRR